jgi:hypothetical protein
LDVGCDEEERRRGGKKDFECGILNVGCSGGNLRKRFLTKRFLTADSRRFPQIF